FVLLIMNPRGATAILSSKVKLGADMSAAAGPKGRDPAANTDATLRAEILTYSRSRGLFAGISLEGSTLRPDNDANEKLYGKKVNATEIIRKGAVAVPPSGQKLVSLLERKSPKTRADPYALKYLRARKRPPPLSAGAAAQRSHVCLDKLSISARA